MIFWVVITAAVASYTLPKAPQLAMAAGINLPGVQPLQVGEPQLDLEGTQLYIDIPVENPNNFDSQVSRMTYQVYVEGNQVTEGDTEKSVEIPAESQETVSSSVDIEAGGALSAGVGALANELTGDSTTVRVDGELHLDLGPTTTQIPFEKISSL